MSVLDFVLIDARYILVCLLQSFVLAPNAVRHQQSNQHLVRYLLTIVLSAFNLCVFFAAFDR